MASQGCTAPIFLTYLFWLAFFGAGQAKSHQTKSAVPLYDEGGTFRITLDVSDVQRVKISGELDAFIWEHWSEHHRGKLHIISQTIEGQTTLQSIFIEPDARGHWRVRDESEADTPRGVQPPKSQARIDVYDEVRRVDIQTNQVIPDSEKRATGTYALHLLNKSKGLDTPF